MEEAPEDILQAKLKAWFYKQLFGEDTERISHIAQGSHSCTYKIETIRIIEVVSYNC